MSIFCEKFAAFGTAKFSSRKIMNLDASIMFLGTYLILYNELRLCRNIKAILCVVGPHKDIQNMQTRIQNKSYLTAFYKARKWDQNKNSHKKCPQDAEKSLQ